MKPSINVPYSGDPALKQALDAIKENIEIITGRRGGAVQPLTGGLASTAATADIAARVNVLSDKINEIVSKLS